MNSENENTNSVNRCIRPVFISSDLLIEEQSYFLEHILIGLADESISVGLVCSPNAEMEAIGAMSVEIIPYPELRIPFMARYNLRRLLERLEKFKPTVLHCLCEKQSGLVRQISKELNIPYVQSVNRLQKKGFRLSLSLKRCTRIIAPSPIIADNLAKNYPRFAQRISHINMGTFIGQTSWCFSDSNKLASIITADSSGASNEFDVLLESIRNLAIEGYEFMLVMIINEESESRIRKQLSELSLSYLVTVMPRGSQWKQVLDAGDIFVQPQPVPALNSIAMEAMSVGTAVAACKGGVDDIFIDDRTAIIFDPDDELSIRTALKKLLDQKDFARQLAQKAQQYIKQNHSVSAMVTKMLNVYETAPSDFERLA
ncbi:MAG: glycosyltransferase family 4 protein [Phycisphaerae bacterium]|nr:glycosyltransferase family 4 protein [Phycisphaerae bacterium]